MARARNIKPSIFKNEILGTADPLLTILFESLWCLSDREGRLEDRPLRIKGETFPYRENINIEKMLTNLEEFGFIKRYKVSGVQTIQVINFKKHQTPHSTEKASVLPECDYKSLISNEHESTSVKNLSDFGNLTAVKRPDSLIPDLLIPDSFNLNPDSKNIVTVRKNSDLDFEEFWRIYPKRPGANKTQALNAWNTRIRRGATAAEMQHGAMRYRQYCEAMQTEGKYIKQASTFLGPDEHFKLEWKADSKSGNFDDWLRGGGDDGIIDV